MEEVNLEVFERVNVPKELRKSGSIPGVLYGEGYENGVPVAFDEAELKRIIKHHGANAKIMVDFNGDKKLGFIKELQRHSITKQILHSDIQVTSQNHKIRTKVPVHFTGNADLERNSRFLQVYGSHVEIAGEANIIPESITINVAGMKLHDTIKVKDLSLDSRLKVYDDENEVLAVIIEMKGFNAEPEPEEEQV